MATVRDGEAFVAGTGKDLARRLVDRAVELGHPKSAVRFDTAGGFIVPADVAEAPKPPAKKAPAKPRKSRSTKATKE